MLSDSLDLYSYTIIGTNLHIKSTVFWDITCFHAGFLLGLFFDTEDGGDMFLRNVGWLPADYMVLYPEDSTLHNHRCENLKSCKFHIHSENIKLHFCVFCSRTQSDVRKEIYAYTQLQIQGSLSISNVLVYFQFLKSN
jgi:hypothetical protein